MMILNAIQLLRPRQWIKSAICLAGVVFSGRWTDPQFVALALIAAAVVAFGSSGAYVVNDVIDRDRDAKHPKKKNRPVASGAISRSAALILAVGIISLSLAAAQFIDDRVFICLALLLINMFCYSLWLKHQPILDVYSIAAGYILRLFAGIYAIDLLPTGWIALCTFALALLIGFSKRYSELYSIEGDASEPMSAADSTQRPVLATYSQEFLKMLINSASVITVMSYALFTITSGHNPTLFVTTPIVALAVHYYQRLVVIKKAGQEPERLIFSHPKLIALFIIWLVVYLVIERLDIRLLA